MRNFSGRIVVPLFLLVTIFSCAHAYAGSGNTGQSAEGCIKTWRVYDRVLKYEKFWFENQCGKDTFVIYCGALRYSNKKCNAGTVPGFYTHSMKLPAGATLDVPILFNGQITWGACEGGVSFGHEEFTDTPDGRYSCINNQKIKEKSSDSNPSKDEKAAKAHDAKDSANKTRAEKAAHAKSAKEAARKARAEKAAAAKLAREEKAAKARAAKLARDEKAARARAAKEPAEAQRVPTGNNSNKSNYICLASQSLGTCASYYQCTPANNSSTDFYYHTSNGGDFHGNFNDPPSIDAAAQRALKSCGI